MSVGFRWRLIRRRSCAVPVGGQEKVDFDSFIPATTTTPYSEAYAKPGHRGTGHLLARMASHHRLRPRRQVSCGFAVRVTPRRSGHRKVRQIENFDQWAGVTFKSVITRPQACGLISPRQIHFIGKPYEMICVHYLTFCEHGRFLFQRDEIDVP